MVKPTKGFMSEDGNFFETEAEAEFHEAETNLMMYLGSSHLAGPEIDRHMETCVTHKDAIRRYLNAYEAVNQQESITTTHADSDRVALGRLLASADSYTQDGSTRAEGYEAVQSQSDHGHSDVSTVGSGPHSEEVQDGKAVDGA